MNYCHNCRKPISVETPHLVVKVEHFGSNPLRNVFAGERRVDYDSAECAVADFPKMIQEA